MSPSAVYLLFHDHELEGDEDSKLLGVYSTEDRANERIERARLKPGFSAQPDGFVIDRYEVDRDEWIDGFVTV